MRKKQIFTIFTLLLFLQHPNSSQLIAHEQQTILEIVEKKSNIQPGTIILLNGTSSAGKSTLLYELHKNYFPSFHIARIDDYIKTPQGYAKKTRYQNFYNHIKKIASSGQSVLVDTVGYQQNYEKYDEILKPCKLIKVLVYCPLDVLIMHVQQRNKSGMPNERRTINQAFWQYLTLYTMQHSLKDIIIDTTTEKQIQDYLSTAESITQKSSWRKARRQRKINHGIAKEFHDTSSSKQIGITPRHQWNFIVNTGIDTPENIAQKIVNFVEMNPAKNRLYKSK